MFKVFKKEKMYIVAYESIGDYAINLNGELLEKNTWEKDTYVKVPNQNDFIIVNMEEITDECLKSKIITNEKELKIYKYRNMYLSCTLSQWYIIIDLKQYLYNICH